MDGTTGAVQDRMRHAHRMVSHRVMFNMNLWSSLYLVIPLLVTGEMFEFSQFVSKYPDVLLNLFLLSVASALGQVRAPLAAPHIARSISYSKRSSCSVRSRVR
jgi:hypothetical protein